MKKLIGPMVFIVILLFLLAGCNLPSGQPEVSGQQSAQTLAAQTIEARLTENASGGDQSPDGEGQDPVTPSDTPQPSNTTPPTDTPQPSNTPLPTATETESVPCNRAGFVKDVTVPDGKVYAPGDTFTKTWRLRNTGSCTWNSDYDLVFDSGDKMGAADVVDLSIGDIEPDETVDISVDLTAPAGPGEYRGDWLLRGDDNEVFGLGNSDVAFYVEIEVAEEASFEILSTNVYQCGLDDYVAFRLRNTGTMTLDSSGGSVENLSNNNIIVYLFWNTPFTENEDDCPTMNISDMEPGDVYYVTSNMGTGNSGIDFKFELTLCTQENGGGECDTQTVTVGIP